MGNFKFKPLIFAVVTFMFLSCGGGESYDPLHCGSGEARKFDVVDMEFEVYKSADSRNVGEYLNTQLLELNESVTFDQLVLELESITERVISESVSPQPKVPQWGLIAPAFACSPAPPHTDESIDYIIITSDSDFAEGFPAGSDLSELFDIQFTDALGAEFYGFDIESEQAFAMSVEDYLAQSFTHPSGQMYQLVLNQAPDSNSYHQFNIEYGQKNGEVFVGQTSRVFLVVD